MEVAISAASSAAGRQVVPIRWPGEWTDAKLVSLVKESPINCLLMEGAASGQVADAARGAGLEVRESKSLGAASDIVVLDDAVWPYMKPMVRRSERGQAPDASAGPTGAPWIDSNSWRAQLAASRAPGKEIWLDFAPPKDLALNENSYRIAVADTAANGARWMVSLDEKLRAGVAAGNAEAMKTWSGLTGALAFFEKRASWRTYSRQGPLGAISTFSGPDEYMGTEFLNLAARRNLLVRVLDVSRAAAADLSGLRAVIYLDAAKPDQRLAAKMAAFAKGGGLVIAPAATAALFASQGALDCPVAGYKLWKHGSGTVASPVREWEDPYWVAAETHDLVSRRHDPLRLFNAGSLWVHYSVAPGGGHNLIQLISFSSFGGRGGGAVSFRIPGAHKAVTMHTLDGAGPAALKPVEADGKMEYQLPGFSVYAALEVAR